MLPVFVSWLNFVQHNRGGRGCSVLRAVGVSWGMDGMAACLFDRQIVGMDHGPSVTSQAQQKRPPGVADCTS